MAHDWRQAAQDGDEDVRDLQLAPSRGCELAGAFETTNNKHITAWVNFAPPSLLAGFLASPIRAALATYAPRVCPSFGQTMARSP